MRFTFILIILSLQLNSQNWLINYHIKKIDNSQFIIHHNQKASFETNSNSIAKLVNYGSSAIPKLIEALSDSNKNIIAHLILCQISYNKVSFAGPKEKTINELTYNTYYLGEEKGDGVILTEEKKQNTFTIAIEKKELEEIILFWKTKYPGN